jgi:phosphoribosyl 1,2-cyclic phosphate phosphodiesterase
VKLIFLGTGTSYGVPQVGCGCAVCRSTDPRDKRSRVGAAIESDGGARILFDTPPELRLQLLAAGIDDVDAVFFTHDHADHTHGIDDIRSVTVKRAAALAMYGPGETMTRLSQKFPYIFDERLVALPGTAKPEGIAISLDDGQRVRVGDLDVVAVSVPHGHVRVFGYRVGPIGYITDAKSIPEAAVRALRGCSVLVLNALFRTPHPTHLSLFEALHAASRIGADRTFLTHLTHDNVHADLERELPPEVRPAYDGLVVEVASR